MTNTHVLFDYTINSYGDFLSNDLLVSLSEAKKDRPYVLVDMEKANLSVNEMSHLLSKAQQTPNVVWMLQTDKPESISGIMDNVCFPDSGCAMFNADDGLYPNVYVGTLIRNQDEANSRIPKLMKVPARLLFVRVQPTEEVHLDNVHYYDDLYIDCIAGYYGSKEHKIANCFGLSGYRNIGWLIIGGQYGDGASPVNPWYFYRLQHHANMYRCPLFFEGWGRWVPSTFMSNKNLDGAISAHYPWAEKIDGELTGNTTLMFEYPNHPDTLLLNGQEWQETP